VIDLSHAVAGVELAKVTPVTHLVNESDVAGFCARGLPARFALQEHQLRGMPDSSAVEPLLAFI